MVCVFFGEAGQITDTLLDFSQDGQEFVLEKKSARKSGFIRSMLGEHTKDSGESSNHVAAAKASAMTAVGTSPHKASENDDPEPVRFSLRTSFRETLSNSLVPIPWYDPRGL